LPREKENQQGYPGECRRQHQTEAFSGILRRLNRAELQVGGRGRGGLLLRLFSPFQGIVD
jgi:hypothetical protein